MGMGQVLTNAVHVKNKKELDSANMTEKLACVIYQIATKI